MPFRYENLDCNIFGDFKVGDNAVHNAEVLCELISLECDGLFNKLIVIQIASLIEAASSQIFVRAATYVREGVPNVSVADRLEIAAKQIDKFAVIIDNLRKYHILDVLGIAIYDDLHRLRRLRNKVHIQSDVEGQPRDEDRLFSDEMVIWAVDLNWRILTCLKEHYGRPAHIQGNVQPLRLPRST